MHFHIWGIRHLLPADVQSPDGNTQPVLGRIGADRFRMFSLRRVATNVRSTPISAKYKPREIHYPDCERLSEARSEINTKAKSNENDQNANRTLARGDDVCHASC